MIRIVLVLALSFASFVAFSQTLSVKSDSIMIERKGMIKDNSNEKGEVEFDILVNAIGKIIQAEPVQSTLSKELTQIYRQDLLNNVIVNHKTGKALKTRVYYKK
jgi:hypothetical protein